MATDFNAGVTRTTFLDTSQRTVLVHANGLSEISTFNRAGELISFSRSEAGANLSTHRLGGQSRPSPHRRRHRHRAGKSGRLTGEALWASTHRPRTASSSRQCTPANVHGVDAGGGNLYQRGLDRWQLRL